MILRRGHSLTFFSSPLWATAQNHVKLKKKLAAICKEMDEAKNCTCTNNILSKAYNSPSVEKKRYDSPLWATTGNPKFEFEHFGEFELCSL
jgi:hypothetical protein